MNFEFYNPTKLIFGAGKLSQLGQVASQYGKKALTVNAFGVNGRLSLKAGYSFLEARRRETILTCHSSNSW